MLSWVMTVEKLNLLVSMGTVEFINLIGSQK